MNTKFLFPKKAKWVISKQKANKIIKGPYKIKKQ